ncbi:MAG: type I-E CRISPR-associated protein Cse2/CasB [Persicimonas sp.]
MNNPRSPDNDQPTLDATDATDMSETSETTPQAPEALPLHMTVYKIAGFMSRDQYAEGGISKGDLAELRRIDPAEPFTPALWKVLLEYVPDHDKLSAEQERRWAILLMAMATCAGLHDSDTAFGKALAEAGWSELRFVRLMEARGDNLVKEIRRLAQYLASKNQPADWTDAAWLLFVQRGDAASDIRQSIARAYYKQLYVEGNQGD